ncbi:hypothetical protein [Streptomyces sp. SID3343]|uniref:hypothetical protein n=1 Tax=Streptomyces sp. SID3343 TaxID=2690260 RepID=UPI0013718F8D|nr:hypothetical protein [Streptomyces sp. SID3343]MYW03648.1 hypothetical protein [Streptomyces sp. SID3343]
MVRPNKRVAGGLAAFAVAAGSVLASAPQAQAAVAKTQVSCEIPEDYRKYMGNVPVVSGAMDFSVSGPATAKAGEAITLTVDPGPSPAQGPPMDITVKATSTMEFSTNAGGKVTAKGAPGDLTLTKAGGPIDIKPFTISVTVPQAATGKFELQPTLLGLLIDVTTLGLKIDVPCKATKTAVAYSATIPGAATTTTTGNTTSGSTTTTGKTTSGTTAGSTTTTGKTTSGTTAGSTTTTGKTTSGTTAGSTTTTGKTTSGTTTSGTTTTTSGGTLPKTGPLDDALSMGLLGGTVGLLGIGGVLLATRRARASRNA